MSKLPVITPTFRPVSTPLAFHIPPTILSDFRQFTYTDVPNTNFTFEVIQDWYATSEEGYEKQYIRAEMYPINWKSKMGNSDQSMNFKTSYDVRLRKGDILIREDGQIFIINWKIQEYINAQNSQINIANLPLTIYRHVEETLSSTGYLATPAFNAVIVPEIPAIWKIYIGRPDYQVIVNTPGIAPSDISEVFVQYNSHTANIRIDDLFRVEQYEYRVVEVQYSELDYDREYGLIYLQAKRNAGAETEQALIAYVAPVVEDPDEEDPPPEDPPVEGPPVEDPPVEDPPPEETPPEETPPP